MITKLITTAFFILSFSLVSSAQCRTAMPIEDKVAFFKTHLSNILETEKLNGTQRRLIVKGLEVVTYEFYFETAKPDFASTPFGKKFAKYIKDINANFTAFEVKRIFDPKESFAGDCSCSTTWTFCGDGFSCSTERVCIMIIDCGPFWSFQCDGLCKAVVPQNDVKDN